MPQPLIATGDAFDKADRVRKFEYLSIPNIVADFHLNHGGEVLLQSVVDMWENVVGLLRLRGLYKAFRSAAAGRPATGYINVVRPESLVDGETFTLNDGVNPAKTFEYRKTAGGTPGNVTILLTIVAGGSGDAVTDTDVMNLTIQAINGAAPLGISAVTSSVINGQPAGSELFLTNDVEPASLAAAEAQNVVITDTVNDERFTHEGMAGALHRAAVGRINVPTPAALVDGEFFTVPGVVARTYEFDRNSDGVTPGRVLVDVNSPGVTTDVQVAAAVVAAVNGETGATGVSAISDPVRATGYVTALHPVHITDGDNFTLNDGVNPPTVFEFDTLGNGVTPGRVAITTFGLLTVQQVRAAVIAAINGVAGTLNITASSPGQGQTVTLTHDTAGAVGNQTIVAAVASGHFLYAGMSGGSQSVKLTQSNTGTAGNGAITEEVSSALFSVSGMSGGMDAGWDVSDGHCAFQGYDLFLTNLPRIPSVVGMENFMKVRVRESRYTLESDPDTIKVSLPGVTQLLSGPNQIRWDASVVIEAHNAVPPDLSPTPRQETSISDAVLAQLDSTTGQTVEGVAQTLGGWTIVADEEVPVRVRKFGMFVEPFDFSLVVLKTGCSDVVATGGMTGQLTVKPIIPTHDAIIAVGGANARGLVGTGGTGTAVGVEGFGTGTEAGVKGTGGPTSGPGVYGLGGGPNGQGVVARGTGTGEALHALGGTNGRGAYIQGTGNSDGAFIMGGPLGGEGLQVLGPAGIGVLASSFVADGVYGSTLDDGFVGVRGVHAGTNGVGVRGDGTGTGSGVEGYGEIGGTGRGVRGTGTGTGQGVYGQGGTTSGTGVEGVGGGPNGDGVKGTALGSGAGVRGDAGSSGFGVHALASNSLATALRAIATDGVDFTPPWAGHISSTGASNCLQLVSEDGAALQVSRTNPGGPSGEAVRVTVDNGDFLSFVGGVTERLRVTWDGTAARMGLNGSPGTGVHLHVRGGAGQDAVLRMEVPSNTNKTSLQMREGNTDLDGFNLEYDATTDRLALARKNAGTAVSQLMFLKNADEFRAFEEETRIIPRSAAAMVGQGLWLNQIGGRTRVLAGGCLRTRSWGSGGTNTAEAIALSGAAMTKGGKVFPFSDLTATVSVAGAAPGSGTNGRTIDGDAAVIANQVLYGFLFYNAGVNGGAVRFGFATVPPAADGTYTGAFLNTYFAGYAAADSVYCGFFMTGYAFTGGASSDNFFGNSRIVPLSQGVRQVWIGRHNTGEWVHTASGSTNNGTAYSRFHVMGLGTWVSSLPPTVTTLRAALSVKVVNKQLDARLGGGGGLVVRILPFNQMGNTGTTEGSALEPRPPVETRVNDAITYDSGGEVMKTTYGRGGLQITWDFYRAVADGGDLDVPDVHLAFTNVPIVADGDVVGMNYEFDFTSVPVVLIENVNDPRTYNAHTLNS